MLVRQLSPQSSGISGRLCSRLLILSSTLNSFSSPARRSRPNRKLAHRHRIRIVEGLTVLVVHDALRRRSLLQAPSRSSAGAAGLLSLPPPRLWRSRALASSKACRVEHAALLLVMRKVRLPEHVAQKAELVRPVQDRPDVAVEHGRNARFQVSRLSFRWRNAFSLWKSTCCGSSKVPACPKSAGVVGKLTHEKVVEHLVHRHHVED